MHVHDVLIIGGGPCGLAAAARLREHTPSATFTDDEHQRYHWIRKHGRKMNIKNYRTNVDSMSASSSKPGDSKNSDRGETKPQSDDLDMLVLDADGGDWMAKWNRLFKMFGIINLRSPMFFHIDPADRDALLAYAYEEEREKELQALPGCAGKEMSKHRRKKLVKGKGKYLGRTPDVDERDRKDYFTPSTALFHSHCSEVVRRYGLQADMLKHEKVNNIEYDDAFAFQDAEHDSFISDQASVAERKIFRVTTDQGVRFASIVILAIGPGNAPSIPTVVGLPAPTPHEGYAHSMQLKQFPPAHVIAKIKNRERTNMLIVGGGLTSVQLADLALKRGVSKIWLLLRGPIKVKYFDVDLDWVGKFRNFNQAAFWSADTDDERWQMMLEARNGGSMTPRYRKILDAHVGSGKISLHTYTTLSSVSWDAESHTFSSITTSPSADFPSMDYIVFATGIQTNIHTIPFMQSVLKNHPIECIGGLPCLNDDLMWNDEVPLFANGRLAGLRLGPAAPNLIGARIGAERIAWNVDDMLQKLGKGKGVGSREVDGESGDEKLTAYAAGRRNRFDSLVDVSTD